MSVKICPSCKMYTNVKGKKCPNFECNGRLFKVPNEWVAAATSALEKGYILTPDNWLFYPGWIDIKSYFMCILEPICVSSVP